MPRIHIRAVTLEEKLQGPDAVFRQCSKYTIRAVIPCRMTRKGSSPGLEPSVLIALALIDSIGRGLERLSGVQNS
jgi:hypothetical protein